ncbi:hypothetical protein OUZ56_003498 [Daphnia magna]|uniref:Uncharacterized protein n=1 Tax=Daphnia magna TaxID=35525 RepID=A0ABR0A8W5_9CRUS|nr:hypothetical protein OUZ56_003498 [Daphnia magna]
MNTTTDNHLPKVGEASEDHQGTPLTEPSSGSSLNENSSNADLGQRFIPSRKLLPFRTAYLRIFLRADLS